MISSIQAQGIVSSFPRNEKAQQRVRFGNGQHDYHFYGPDISYYNDAAKTGDLKKITEVVEDGIKIGGDILRKPGKIAQMILEAGELPANAENIGDYAKLANKVLKHALKYSSIS